MVIVHSLKYVQVEEDYRHFLLSLAMSVGVVGERAALRMCCVALSHTLIIVGS